MFWVSCHRGHTINLGPTWFSNHVKMMEICENVILISLKGVRMCLFVFCVCLWFWNEKLQNWVSSITWYSVYYIFASAVESDYMSLHM